MGYRQICLEELNKYIEKYDGHIYLKLKKVIIENMLCKSKAELAIVKNKYASLINEVFSPSFIMTDEIRSYIQRFLNYAKRKVVELETVINNLKISSSW